MIIVYIFCLAKHHDPDDELSDVELDVQSDEEPEMKLTLGTSSP